MKTAAWRRMTAVQRVRPAPVVATAAVVRALVPVDQPFRALVRADWRGEVASRSRARTAALSLPRASRVCPVAAVRVRVRALQLVAARLRVCQGFLVARLRVCQVKRARELDRARPSPKRSAWSNSRRA